MSIFAHCWHTLFCHADDDLRCYEWAHHPNGATTITRVYLQCQTCRRETPGWDVSSERVPSVTQ